MTLLLHGIDISHSRLVDLAKLADQAKPFYDWVEAKARRLLKTAATLDETLKGANQRDITALLAACYGASAEPNVPILTDGVGRSYPHSKACYYFFCLDYSRCSSATAWPASYARRQGIWKKARRCRGPGSDGSYLPVSGKCQNFSLGSRPRGNSRQIRRIAAQY